MTEDEQHEAVETLQALAERCEAVAEEVSADGYGPLMPHVVLLAKGVEAMALLMAAFLCPEEDYDA